MISKRIAATVTSLILWSLLSVLAVSAVDEIALLEGVEASVDAFFGYAPSSVPEQVGSSETQSWLLERLRVLLDAFF